MDTPTLFKFDERLIRVVADEAGEPLFVGKDVCDALGYVNDSKAMSDHCKGVTKRYPLQTAGGMQLLRVLTEPDVMRLIVGSTLPAAQAFERLVFEEILPSIRKTGAYVVPGAPARVAKPTRRSKPSVLSDARAIDFIGNLVARVPGARADVVAAIKLQMIEECTGLPATQFRSALPAETFEQAAKLNPTEVGRRLVPMLRAAEVNKILIRLGLQRKVESGYVLTEAGTAYGESRPFQATNHYVGDQISWYESVVNVIAADIERPPPQQQGALPV